MTGSIAGLSACRNMIFLSGNPCARAVRMNGLRNTSIMLPRVKRAT